MQARQKTLLSYVLAPPNTLPPPLQSTPIRGADNVIIPAPAHCFVGAFGVRYATVTLQMAHQDALRSGEKLYPIMITLINHRGTTAERFDMDNLMDTDFISLGRLKKKLASEILLAIGEKPNDNLNNEVARNPGLINLIWENEQFAHISLIAWRSNISRSQIVQYMAVKTADFIEKIEISYYDNSCGEWNSQLDQLFS